MHNNPLDDALAEFAVLVKDAIADAKLQGATDELADEVGKKLRLGYKGLVEIARKGLLMDEYTDMEIAAGLAFASLATVGVYHTNAIESLAGQVGEAFPDLSLFR